ncbi:MAG: hypothetical protein B7C24_17400 [Bacteroidetes bacterium 4572_77]|nr:MAG: hypothetical protein B7C24_17400 [Bacteroidetes bacterium 4572_77]
MKRKFDWYNFIGGFIFGTILILISITFYTNTIKQEIPPKTPTIVQPTKMLANIIQRKQPKLDPKLVNEIANSIYTHATHYNLPPELILCLIERESTFNPLSISKKNCVGLMQISVKFHKDKLKKFNIKRDQIFFIDNNIRIGCLILKEYYDKSKSISGALKSYVGGTETQYRYDILSSYADLIIQQSTTSKTIKKINLKR